MVVVVVVDLVVLMVVGLLVNDEIGGNEVEVVLLTCGLAKVVLSAVLISTSSVNDA